MVLNLESLLKLGKEVLAGMVLDHKDKVDSTLPTTTSKAAVDPRHLKVEVAD